MKRSFFVFLSLIAAWVTIGCASMMGASYLPEMPVLEEASAPPTVLEGAWHIAYPEENAEEFIIFKGNTFITTRDRSYYGQMGTMTVENNQVIMVLTHGFNTSKQQWLAYTGGLKQKPVTRTFNLEDTLVIDPPTPAATPLRFIYEGSAMDTDRVIEPLPWTKADPADALKPIEPGPDDSVLVINRIQPATGKLIQWKIYIDDQQRGILTSNKTELRIIVPNGAHVLTADFIRNGATVDKQNLTEPLSITVNSTSVTFNIQQTKDTGTSFALGFTKTGETPLTGGDAMP
jgi:hypothetical protein